MSTQYKSLQVTKSVLNTHGFSSGSSNSLEHLHEYDLIELDICSEQSESDDDMDTYDTVQLDTWSEDSVRWSTMVARMLSLQKDHHFHRIAARNAALPLLAYWS